MLVMAVTDLQTEDYKITDPRWHAPEGWLEMDSVPLPDRAEIDRLHEIIDDESVLEEERRQAFFPWMRLCVGASLKDKKMYDVIAWDPEYGLPNVLGVVIAELEYGNECLYALFSILEERGVFSQQISEFLELPHLATEDNFGMDARYWSMFQKDPEGFPKEQLGHVQAYQRLLDRDWNYGSGVGIYVEVYGDKAMYLLHDVLGMDITEKDLRLGIYWLWC